MKMVGLIILLVGIAATAGEAQLSLHGCPDKCGHVDIPYPFGVGDRCSLNRHFNLTCNHTTSTLYYSLTDIRVSNISLHDAQMDIYMYVSQNCYDHLGKEVDGHSFSAFLIITAFPISSSANKFVSVGCDSYGYLTSFQDGQNYTTGCLSRCNQRPLPVNNTGGETCSGIGCCQIDIPPRMRNITFQSYSFNNHRNVWEFNNCSYAFVAKTGSFHFSPDYLEHLPFEESKVVLDWSVVDNGTCQEANSVCNPKAYCKNSDSGYGYRCFCKPGFLGNPYHPHGCLDVDECLAPNDCDTKAHALCNNFDGGYNCSCPPGYIGDGYVNGSRCTRDATDNSRSLIIALGVGIGVGLLSLFLSGHKLYQYLRQKQEIVRKEKLFKQNGGHLLQEKMSCYGNGDKARLFTAEELERATDKYNQSRFLGQGGFGTVYKGMLPDGTIVAVKKAKEIVRSQIENFINEVVILSQINHRQIVKLLGWCLETEAPLLVYEFIPNGTLSHHIHNQELEGKLSWDNRLRIACEVSGAVAYMHSAASIPVFHRDIKTSNILLDHKYSAKVSDFGTSRSVPNDRTHLTTVVQGTFGYIDPEYFQSSQFTDKSDVYSFGVVLIELISGKKPITFSDEDQGRNLVTEFIALMKEDRVFEILDARVVHEGRKDDIISVVNLAKRCVRLNGKKRPTMQEASAELEGLRRTQNSLEITDCSLEFPHKSAMCVTPSESDQESTQESMSSIFQIDSTPI